MNRQSIWEDGLQHLCECGELGYWKWNADYDQLLVDGKLMRILGYKNDNEQQYFLFHKAKWFNLMHEKDQKKWQSILYLKNELRGSVITFEQKLLTGSNEYHRFLLEAHVKENLYGSLAILEGTLSDLSMSQYEDKYFRAHKGVDEVTGLFNRRLFMKYIQKLCQTGESPVTVIIGDIMGFHSINKCYGWELGDRVLQFVGDAFRSVCSKNGVVFRIGDDEFAAVLSEVNEETGRLACGKISNLISSFKHGAIHLNLSIGYATGKLPGMAYEELIRMAQENWA
jgi:diguanylate cyclase (GGDEF) domain